jgi:hypothetical protein
MSTELQQHAEGNTRNAIQGGLVRKELAFNVEAERLEAIYRTRTGEGSGEFLHFPSQEKLGSPGGAALIGTTEGNLQQVLDDIAASQEQGGLGLQFDDVNGTLAPNIRSPRRFFSQFTRDEANGGHEIVGYGEGTLGTIQYLKPPGVSGNWLPIGLGWTFSGGAIYTPPPAAEGGGITQTFDTSPSIAPGSRWFRLSYTIADAGAPSQESDLPEIEANFTGNNIRLDVGNGTHIIYFKSESTGTTTLTIKGNGVGFTITALDLREIQGGNLDVHGKITGGGSDGIRVDGKGILEASKDIKIKQGNLDLSATSGNKLILHGRSLTRPGNNPFIAVNTETALNNLMSNAAVPNAVIDAANDISGTLTIEINGAFGFVRVNTGSAASSSPILLSLELTGIGPNSLYLGSFNSQTSFFHDIPAKTGSPGFSGTGFIVRLHAVYFNPGAGIPRIDRINFTARVKLSWLLVDAVS